MLDGRGRIAVLPGAEEGPRVQPDRAQRQRDETRRPARHYGPRHLGAGWYIADTNVHPSTSRRVRRRSAHGWLTPAMNMARQENLGKRLSLAKLRVAVAA